MRSPVTYLFVPGDRPERFDKAIASGADAVIVDLEDAVAAEDKDRARGATGQWIGRHPEVAPRVVVRINDAGSTWIAADLALVGQAGIARVMLPKAETAAQIDRVMAAMPAAGRVLPLLETARGVQNVEAVAAANGVERLAFGNLDFGVDLGLTGDDRGLIYAASRIAIASRCAGLPTPIAGVTPELDDEPRLLADLAWGRALGFGAKLCIHPRQVAAIRNALRPTAEEVDWARRVLAAAKGHKAPRRWTAAWSIARCCAKPGPSSIASRTSGFRPGCRSASSAAGSLESTGIPRHRSARARPRISIRGRPPGGGRQPLPNCVMVTSE